MNVVCRIQREVVVDDMVNLNMVNEEDVGDVDGMNSDDFNNGNDDNEFDLLPTS